MTKNSVNKLFALAGLNLMAVGNSGLGLDSVQAASAPNPAQNESAILNTASLSAIESTWLKVPMSCKAKGFNAEPISVPAEPLSEKTLAIFNAYNEL